MNKKEANRRVGLKIGILEKEGDRPDVAIATALNMQRKDRIGPQGEYRHVRKSKSRTGGRRG